MIDSLRAQGATIAMERQRGYSSPAEPVPTEDVPLEISEVSMDRLDTIRRLNVAIFDDTHIIETFGRDDLLILLGCISDTAVGFKIGYRLDDRTFYSAKGGVHPSHRRKGIARALLHAMLDEVERRGYDRFIYDTFPNKHPGMTVLGLDEGFEVVRAGYSPQFQDYRLRFEWTFDDA